MRLLIPTALALALTTPLHAQNFTTSAEVKPILEMIKPQWVAVRPYEGRDLLYFTLILAYRCGIEEISFATNGGELQVLEHEPCYTEEATPNALKVGKILPYIEAPLDSIESIDIQLKFDDGSTAEQSYDRKSVQIN